MNTLGRSVAVVAAVTLLWGCETASDPLGTSASDQETSSQEQTDQAQAGEQAESDGSGDGGGMEMSAGDGGEVPEGRMPGLGSERFEPRPLPDFQPTDTFVGRKVTEFRKDLQKLKSNVSEHNTSLQELRQRVRRAARRYHNLVADIRAQLQSGTTPGNPRLVKAWNQAQAELARMDRLVQRMTELANRVSSTAALAGFLLESVESSYTLSGAVEADHEHLRALEDSTNQTVVLLERLRNQLSADLSRQKSYLERERNDLQMLSVSIKNGEFYGESLANKTDTSANVRAPERGGEIDITNRTPLVVIRFDRDDVAYEEPVYNAVQRALDADPRATFQVVAVTPRGQQGETSLNRAETRKQAERVLRSLNEMGLPPNRVSLAATTSQQVETNQVHIYVQ